MSRVKTRTGIKPRAHILPANIFLHAVKFREAQLILYESNPHAQRKALVLPACLLAAFTSELLFKCLICIERGAEPPRGHDLLKLFERLGYAWDRWMIFATGGWASASLKGTYCSNLSGLCDGPGVPSGASRNSEGWYAGGGFDYMVHKGTLVDVILGVEYQHFDVGSSSASAGTAPFGFRDAFDLDAKGDLVRARLTIKTQGYGFLALGPAGPGY
jgi:hypothetical protein